MPTKDIFILCGLAALCVGLAFRSQLLQFLGRSQTTPGTPGLEKGQLAEEDIKPKAEKPELPLPDPTPYPNFDLKTAKTRNYIHENKCLRCPYFQTMSHQPMDINHWIEIDKDYEWHLSEKKRVVEEHGKVVLDALPEAEEGCLELLETVVDWLQKRYPTLFERTPEGFHSRVTGESLNTVQRPVGAQALQIISRSDFLLGREREDGHVYFVGGIVAFPGFYLLSEKINKSLWDVHEPVPQFNEKLHFSVERFLKRLRSDGPMERASWEIVDDNNLFWHNMANLHGTGKQVDVHPGDLYFRIDRQTFRKLPKSRLIIFGVHPLLRKIKTMADDPLVPALLAKVHEESAKDLMHYKVAPAYQERLLPYLAELTQSQIDRGLMTDGEDVRLFREARWRKPVEKTEA